MTQLLQAMGLAQGGGVPGGSKTLHAKGAADDLQGARDELLAFAEGLGIAPEDLTPELAAELQYWLWGGVILPQAAISLPLEEGGLPPQVTFAEVLSQAEPAKAGTEGEIEGEAGLEFKLPAGKLTNVLAEAVAFDRGKLAESVVAALSRAGGDTQAAFPAMPVAGLAPGLDAAVRVTPQQAFGPLLAGNLLSMTVPQQVGANGWGQAVGERLLWMVKGDQQVAELKITPPNLGPLEVKLTLNSDQASVTFVSHHAAVRDALEAAVPRLREMMAQESVQLVNVDVGTPGRDGQAASGDAGAPRAEGLAGGTGSGDGPVGSEEHSEVSPQGVGLVDLFV